MKVPPRVDSDSGAFEEKVSLNSQIGHFGLKMSSGRIGMYTRRTQAIKIMNTNGHVSLNDVLDPDGPNREVILRALVEYCVHFDIPYNYDGTNFSRLSNSRVMRQRQEFGVMPEPRQRKFYEPIRKFMISRGVTHRMSLGLNILRQFMEAHGFQSLQDIRYTTVFNETSRCIELIPGGGEYLKFSKNTAITMVPSEVMQKAGQNWADFDFGSEQYLQWFDIDSRRLCIKLLGI